MKEKDHDEKPKDAEKSPEDTRFVSDTPPKVIDFFQHIIEADHDLSYLSQRHVDSLSYYTQPKLSQILPIA